jgi:ribosomal subunit interface protein
MKHINLKTLNMEMTDAIRGYVYDKLASLEKIIHTNAHIVVEIGRPSHHHKKGEHVYMAEISIDSDGQTYFIQITDADLYAAIDKARDEMMELIKQGKGKKQTLLRKGRMMVKRLMKRGFYGN